MRVVVRFHTRGGLSIGGVLFGPGLTEVELDKWLELCELEPVASHLADRKMELCGGPSVEACEKKKLYDFLTWATDELDWRAARTLAAQADNLLNTRWLVRETRKSVREVLIAAWR